MSDTIRIHGVDVDREEYYESTLRELIALRVENDNWVDLLEGDTWGWNQWFHLMEKLLQYKAGGPPDDDTDPKDIVRCQYQGSKEHGWEAGEPYDWVMSKWPETVTWDAQELRKLIGEIEHAMFDAVAHIYIPTASMLEYLINEEYKRRGIPTEDEYGAYCLQNEYRDVQEYVQAMGWRKEEEE